MINHSAVLCGIQCIVSKFFGDIDFEILPCCPHACLLNFLKSTISHLVIKISEHNNPVGFIFGQNLIGQPVGMARIMTVCRTADMEGIKRNGMPFICVTTWTTDAGFQERLRSNSEFMLNCALQGCPTEDGFVFILVVCRGNFAHISVLHPENLCRRERSSPHPELH